MKQKSMPKKGFLIKASGQVQKLFSDAQKLHQRGKLDEAEKLYHRALAINPKCGEVRLALATLWQMKGRLQDAVIEARKAVKDCSQNVMVWSNYGIILKSAGLLEEAKDAYTKALEIAPDAVAPKINLAVILIVKGELDQAKIILEELSEENPEDPVPLMNLACIAIAQDDLDYATECLDKVDDISPNHPDIPTIRAALAHKDRDIKKAVEYAIDALEHNPSSAQSWQLLQNVLKDTALPLDRLESILLRLVTNQVQNTTTLATAVDLCRKNLIWGPLSDLEKYLSSLLDKPQTQPLNSTSCFNLLGAYVSQRAHKYAAESAWQALCKNSPKKQEMREREREREKKILPILCV